MHRRRFVQAACASGLSLGAALPECAKAAEFSFKIGHPAPASHPLHLRLSEAADRIKADTRGRFELRVFPSDQLGSQTDVLGQVRTGATDFFALSGVVLSTLVPASAISGLAFAFKDYDSVWHSMDGGLGNYIRGEIDKVRTLFAFERPWDNGYRQITSSSHPVQSPKDLSGLKIRVPPSAMWLSLFRALGASPATINANELYTSLQTRLVDAQENPLAVVSTLRLYEVQKYCSLTNHMWDGFWILANRANFESLPKEIQSVVRRHFNDSALAERDDLVKLNVSVTESLKSKGLQFAATTPSQFQDVLRAAGFYNEWKAKLPAAGWAQLQNYVGTL